MGIPSVERYVSINDSRDMARNIIYNLAIRVFLERFLPVRLVSSNPDPTSAGHFEINRILGLENRSFKLVDHLL